MNNVKKDQFDNETVAKRYEALYEIGKLFVTEREPRSLLNLAMDKVIEATGAQRGFIALRGKKGRIEFKAARNMRQADIEQPGAYVSLTIVNDVLDSGRVVHTANAVMDRRYAAVDSIMKKKPLSVLCAPIIIENRNVGVIYVDNAKDEDVFDKNIIALMTGFAQIVAISLKNAIDFKSLKDLNLRLSASLRKQRQSEEIVGSSPPMVKLLSMITKVADSDASILISGESGTGKELVAKALHNQSCRAEEAWVSVNCGAIPETLIESELFGHQRGAFTGSVADRRGKFELADGGTIFLDEIGELPKAMQVKLLRILQDGTYSPVGSEITKECDVRVIAATNRDLKAMVVENSFREDLFFRLNVIELTVPPLKNRRSDILLLAQYFLKKYGNDETPFEFSEKAEAALLEYNYPGNVRELENAVHHAIVLSSDKIIDLEHLPESIRMDGYNSGDKKKKWQERKKEAIEKWERYELEKLLTTTRGYVRKASEIADVDLSTFSEKLKKYGIRYSDFR